VLPLPRGQLRHNAACNKPPPNKPVDLTPLRGLQIAAILKTGFGSIAFPIYHCGAGDGQGVGRRIKASLVADGFNDAAAHCTGTCYLPALSVLLMSGKRTRKGPALG